MAGVLNYGFLLVKIQDSMAYVGAIDMVKKIVCF